MVQMLAIGDENDLSSDLNMDQIGILEGTDKSSSVDFAWDYLRHYEEWFTPFKDEEICLMEIGVQNGYSLPIWREFFPRAKIVGIDIDPKCARFAGDRVTIEIGSQDDPSFLHDVCSRHKPAIVIDDGSHLAHHVIYTFETVFPLLAPNGLYVVEDLEFHVGDSLKEWAPVPGFSPPTYFLDLAQACMTRKNRDGLWGNRRNIVEGTDDIRFVHSALCVRKKGVHKSPADFSAARRYVERRRLPRKNLLNYLKFMADNGYDIKDLVSQIEDLKPEERDPRFWRVLSELQRLKLGDFEGALKTLSAAVLQFPNNEDLLRRYAEWLCQYGSSDEGIRYFGKAAAICYMQSKTKVVVAQMVDHARSQGRASLAAEVLKECLQESPYEHSRPIFAEGIAALSR